MSDNPSAFHWVEALLTYLETGGNKGDGSNNALRKARAEIDTARGEKLRDYFAAHADQPGVSEIVSMAGHTTDGFWVTFSDERERMRFDHWWNALPLAERLSLAARVRFALADAMLAARKETPNG